MLTKAHRLNKQKDFDAVWQRGDLAQDNFLMIRFLPNHLRNSRFSVVISTKTAKKAISRNRLRRQLSEIIRLHSKNIAPGQDFVLVVKAKLIGVGYQDIEAILINLLKKKKLYA
ncbi:ribonuclease P protein component [Patescibacteria group bacterium]|nr:ribonuclease P protein component [Patescibacteria group bacterium]